MFKNLSFLPDIYRQLCLCFDALLRLEGRILHLTALMEVSSDDECWVCSNEGFVGECDDCPYREDLGSDFAAALKN